MLLALQARVTSWLPYPIYNKWVDASAPFQIKINSFGKWCIWWLLRYDIRWFSNWHRLLFNEEREVSSLQEGLWERHTCAVMLGGFNSDCIQKERILSSVVDVLVWRGKALYSTNSQWQLSWLSYTKFRMPNNVLLSFNKAISSFCNNRFPFCFNVRFSSDCCA